MVRDYYLHTSDITFDFTNGLQTIVHNQHTEPWKVTIVDTGLHTMTGGRIRRVRPYVGDEPFFMTYGDGVCDVNIRDLLEFHRKNGKIATLTAVQVDQRFGVLELLDNTVRAFREKAHRDNDTSTRAIWCSNRRSSGILRTTAPSLSASRWSGWVADQQLASYRHRGYWQCMDTKKEQEQLELLCSRGRRRGMCGTIEAAR